MTSPSNDRCAEAPRRRARLSRRRRPRLCPAFGDAQGSQIPATGKGDPSPRRGRPLATYRSQTAQTQRRLRQKNNPKTSSSIAAEGFLHLPHQAASTPAASLLQELWRSECSPCRAPSKSTSPVSPSCCCCWWWWCFC